MKKILNESVSDMSKEELRQFVKDILEKEMDKKLTKDKEEEVKNIVKALMKKHYYTLWQKSGFFIENL